MIIAVKQEIYYGENLVETFISKDLNLECMLLLTSAMNYL